VRQLQVEKYALVAVGKDYESILLFAEEHESAREIAVPHFLRAVSGGTRRLLGVVDQDVVHSAASFC